MMRVGGALADFELQLRADGRSEHTVKQYGRHVRLLARWMEATGRGDDLAALDHRAVAEFMTSDDALRRPDGEPKMAMSVNALRSSLRCFFGYLHDAGMLRRNPARLLKRARCGPPPPRAIADVDLERMFEAMEADGSPVAKRDRAMFGLMAATGIRLGSLVALRIEDVDLDRHEILLRSTKGDAPYVVSIDASDCNVLRYVVGRQRQGPLFAGPSGRALSRRQVQRRFHAWRARAGAESSTSVHSLRHRCGIQTYERFQDLVAVQRRLGHSSVASSMIYVRSARSHVSNSA